MGCKRLLTAVEEVNLLCHNNNKKSIAPHLVHALNHPSLYGGHLVPGEQAELADDPRGDALWQQILVPVSFSPTHRIGQG